jgi:hypothetical protein
MVVVVHELRLAERLVVPSNFWWLLEDLGQSLPLSLRALLPDRYTISYGRRDLELHLSPDTLLPRPVVDKAGGGHVFYGKALAGEKGYVFG